jgi:hypothetical protein
MVISCKLYTNGQWIKVYILTIYIIHVKCDDIMLNHHLWLNVAYNFIHATNEFFIVHVVTYFILWNFYSFSSIHKNQPIALF